MEIHIDVQRPAAKDPAVVHQAILTGVNRIMLLALRRGILNVSGGVLKVRHGQLRTSLRAQVAERGADVVGTLGAAVAHAEPLEKGAKPHIIRARRARALRIGTTSVRGARVVSTRRGLVRAGGRQVTTSVRFAKFVRHPGNRPYRFLETALRDTIPEMAPILQAEVTRALDRGV